MDADTQEAAQQAFNDGTEQFSLGRYENAAELLNKAKSLDPGMMLAHIHHGLALQKTGRNLEAAATALLSGIELNPHHAASATAFNHLGAIRKQQRRFEDAVSAYKNAIARDWTMSAAHYNLGLVLNDDLGRYEQAVEAFQHALQTDPSHVGVLASLGRAHRLAGFPKRSLASLRQGLLKDPTNSVALHEYGRSLEAAGLLGEALFRPPGTPLGTVPADMASSVAEATVPASADDLYDDDEWGDVDDFADMDDDDIEPASTSNGASNELWRTRRGPRSLVSGDAPSQPLLVLAYMPEGLTDKRGFGFCRMLASAAHNRIDLEVRHVLEVAGFHR